MSELEDILIEALKRKGYTQEYLHSVREIKHAQGSTFFVHDKPFLTIYTPEPNIDIEGLQFDDLIGHYKLL